MQNVTRFVVRPIAFLSVLFLTFIGMQAQKKKAIVYDTINVGDQLWMKKNLDVDKFRNGTKIPQARTREEWVKAGLMKKPAWCYVNDDPILGMKMGKLYNWYAVNDKRGLAPKGWSIPTLEDWVLLKEEAGKKMRNKNRKLQSNSEYWYEEDDEYDSEDEGIEENDSRRNNREKPKQSIFFAEPTGIRVFLNQEWGRGDRYDREYNDKGFFDYRTLTKWWSATEDDTKQAWFFSIGYREDDKGDIYKNEKASGYSVRCIIK
jgi:uncharacterized protein (TIGR02145 family)